MKLYSPDETGWYRAPSHADEFTVVKPRGVKGETFAFRTFALKLESDEDREKLIAKYWTEKIMMHRHALRASESTSKSIQKDQRIGGGPLALKKDTP